MSEGPTLREWCYRIGRLLVLLNPIYWFASVSLVGEFHFSDAVLGWLILGGVFIGLASVVFCAIGKAHQTWQKWALVVVACGETFWWWLMAVGM